MPVNETAVEAENGKAAAPRHGRRAVLGAAASLVFLAGFNRAAFALPRGERRLQLYNPHTDERFQDVFWCDGSYVPESLTSINWLMRDFHRNVVAPIDVDLLDLLQRINQRLETHRPFRILSGYRTAATNRLLQREGWAPAEHSEHLVGKAADICVDRVSLKHLRRAAVSLKAGGVGTYPRDHFIHVDVGPPRVW
jgi:uncharacterized protein YcbK (DUF882 family)